MGDRPTVRRPLLSDLRPPLLSPSAEGPASWDSSRGAHGGHAWPPESEERGPRLCPAPPPRPELKNLPRYWEGGSCSVSCRNIKSYAGHQELADQ